MVDYNGIRLREHQARALEIAERICGGDLSDLGPGNKCITVAAVPGAGKTILASVVGHVFLSAGEVDGILWLSPNLTLCKQVSGEFRKVCGDAFALSDNLTKWIKSIRNLRQTSLAIEHKPGRGKKKPVLFVGASITNDGLCANLDTILAWMDGKRILVIIDEVHHFSSLTDDNRVEGEEQESQVKRVRAWSSALEKVLNLAAWSVAMTGTMFRNDGLPVAGVRYDENKKAIVLIRYTRHKALAERALKRIEVNTSDGQTEMKIRGQDQVVRAQLTQAQRADAGKILKHCIENNGWRWQTIERACVHYDALYNQRGIRSQMLVICDNVAHAKWAAKKLVERYRSTGVRVCLAHSAMDQEEMRAWGDPEVTLARFRAHDGGDILVTVGMAGEGFDAPWIDHLVLLNRVRSKVMLDQYVNRATRINRHINLPWEDQWAFIYCPADAAILEFFAEYFQDVGESYKDVPPLTTERIPSDKPPRERRLVGGIPVHFSEGPTQILDANGSQVVAQEMNSFAASIASKLGIKGVPLKHIMDIIEEARRADGVGR
jgi:superfamily II DNA or RNA helicase